jgi:hypothetical protein
VNEPDHLGDWERALNRIEPGSIEEEYFALLQKVLTRIQLPEDDLKQYLLCF